MKNQKVFYSIEIFGRNNLSAKEINMTLKKFKKHKIHRVFAKKDAIFLWVSSISKYASLDAAARYEYELREAIDSIEINTIKMNIKPYRSEKLRPLWLLMSDVELESYGQENFNF